MYVQAGLALHFPQIIKKKTIFANGRYTVYIYKKNLVFHPLPDNGTYDATEKKNIMEKGENAGKQHFLLFS